MLARVVIVGAVGSVDRLTYAVPQEICERLAPGHRVLVPLRSRRVTAIVTEVGENLDSGGARPKSILEILEPRPLFDPVHLQLIEFLAGYYMAPIGEAFRNVIPSLARVESRKMIRLTAEPHRLAQAAFNPLERSIVEALARHPMALRQIARLGGRPEIQAALTRLIADRWIETYDGTRGRHREVTSPRVRLATASTKILRGRKQREIVERLSMAPEGVPLDQLAKEIPGARIALRTMEVRGVVELIKETNPWRGARESSEESLYEDGGSSLKEADPIPGTSELTLPAQCPEGALARTSDDLELTAEQSAVFSATAPAVRGRRFEALLLWGVTASGKTEIYSRLASEALAIGRQVLLLVPEIALADQLVISFRQRFGPLVAIAHSAQTVTERWASWMAALSGDVRVVIGPRSAIFAPVKDLGLIVVDEEHDASYKQEEGIRYNARDLAVALGRFAGCPVVLGSATPSMESFTNARRGRYKLLRMTRRVRERELARVEIIDLRQHAKPKQEERSEERKDPVTATKEPGHTRSATALQPQDSSAAPVPLSLPLLTALRQNLADGGQSLVFLNRRGYHNFLQCHLCGAVITCTSCSVSLTFHLRGRILRCHYCGASEHAPDKCFECGGFGLEGQGFGTERLVQALAEVLPSARIERMDSDTSGRRGARSAILQGMRRGAVDVLVGTQMITKGFDFPGVTLVAVVLADLALHMPDFRSAERTFQSLTQVAGRAGRGERPGIVMIQTYAPHHYSIRAAGDQDYTRFVRRELELRRELMYPPFARMGLVRIEGEHQVAVTETATKVAAALARAARPETMRVLGPAPAPIERIKRRYRWQVVLKAQARDELRAALGAMRAEVESAAARAGIRVGIDIDPINML